MRRLLPTLLVITGLINAGPSQAEVQNVDFSRFEVPLVSGRDRSLQGATAATKKAAVDRAVYTLFAQTEAEKARYQASRDRVLERLGDYVQDFRVLDKNRQDGDVIIEASATILRSPLKARLVELRVIAAETDGTGSERPRLLTMLDAKSDSPELGEFAISRINDYLSKQQVEVVDSATVRKLLEGDGAISGISRPLELALNSQADLVIVVSAEVAHTRSFGEHQLFQAKVNLQAFAPFSDEPLETKDYLSRELTFREAEDRDKAKRAAIEEAIGGAIEPVSLTLTKAWKEGSEKGHPYRIRLKTSVPDLAQEVENVLKSKGDLLQISATPGETAYFLRYRGKLEGLLEGLVSILGSKVEVESETTSEAILKGS